MAKYKADLEDALIYAQIYRVKRDGVTLAEAKAQVIELAQQEIADARETIRRIRALRVTDILDAEPDAYENEDDDDDE